MSDINSGTVEPRFNEVAGDRPNLFVKWRVRYIEVLFHTFYCNFGRDIEIISFVISRTSLNRGSLNRGSTVMYCTCNMKTIPFQSLEASKRFTELTSKYKETINMVTCDKGTPLQLTASFDNINKIKKDTNFNGQVDVFKGKKKKQEHADNSYNFHSKLPNKNVSTSENHIL